MANAIIILEDRQDGTGLTVDIDFNGKFDENSGAHLFTGMATTRFIALEASKASAIVSRSDTTKTH